MARKSNTPTPPAVPTIGPEKGIELIKRQIEKGRKTIESRPLESEVKRAWQNTTKELLIKCFGSEDAESVRSFLSAGPGSVRMNAPPSYYEQLRVDEVSEQLLMLESCIEVLEMNIETSESSQPAQTAATILAPSNNNVFVVHGRNFKARNSLFSFLRAIGLQPLEWSQAVDMTGKAAPYIGEVLDTAFAAAQAVVVLMTPDDEARLQEQFRSEHDPAYESQLMGQARPNVLFEAGMALGRHPDRTVLVEFGTLRPFSDIGGRHVVRLDNSTASRQNLAQRLQRAGCSVNLKGTDWHDEGDFSLQASSGVEKKII